MLIQHPAVLYENIVSLYFFLLPQRCRISHRRQCASLLHWNLTIPPSLWPDRELRKYHCPCLALTPPPVAIRHLLLRNRYRPDGLHGVQSKICLTKFAWFFPRTLKLIICSFRTAGTEPDQRKVKKEPHDGKEIMNAATRSILGYQVSDNRGVGPCILAMRMAYNQHKRKAHAVKLSILIWL